MVQSIIQYLAEIALVALGILVTRYLIPLLKTRNTTDRWAWVKERVAALVDAAEQTIEGSGMGTKKKAWVVTQLKALGVTVTSEVDALIEAAVYGINAALTAVSDAVDSKTESTADKAAQTALEQLQTTAKDLGITVTGLNAAALQTAITAAVSKAATAAGAAA